MFGRTKIIATIGPASQQKEVLIKMANAGMSVVRLNFSHGDHATHEEVAETIRAINKEYALDVKILQDLEGFRIRIGQLTEPLALKPYQRVRLVKGTHQCDDAIPLQWDDDFSLVEEGMDIYADDGKIILKALHVTPQAVDAEVLRGGELSSRKGINIPGLKFKADILTPKDQRDIEWGIAHQVDFIAQSFVRNSFDIARVRDLVKPHLPECRIIAKIENEDGVGAVDSILDACDGALVARGDLGVSLPIYQIPMIQKKLIYRCNQKRRLAITATQMLDSMTDNFRPTRAEVTDVANAILDGSNYVMLSGETAVGNFPVQSVRMMSQIIDYTEREAATSVVCRPWENVRGQRGAGEEV